MTERRLDALLTGVQAHCSHTAEAAGDLAAMAAAMRQRCVRGVDPDAARVELGQYADRLETISGQLAAGLERLGRLVGDMRGDELADTVPISRDEIAAANSEDP